MVRPPTVAFSVLVLAASFAACAEASGDLRGPTGEVLESQSGVDTSPEQFLNCAANESQDAGSGTRWTDLHRDLFSATGQGGCGNPDCHGRPETTAGQRFQCVDEGKCYDVVVNSLVDLARPERSPLVGIMRHCDSNGKARGSMPKDKRSYYFSTQSMDRVRTWIANGAQRN